MGTSKKCHSFFRFDSRFFMEEKVHPTNHFSMGYMLYIDTILFHMHQIHHEKREQKRPEFFSLSLLLHMLGFYCMSNMKYSFYIEFKRYDLTCDREARMRQ